MITVLLALMTAFASPYRLGSQDVVHVEVRGEASMSADYVVAVDGTILLPEVGKLEVNGHTAHELAEDLTTVLADGYLNNPQVTVTVLEHRSQPVDLAGAVREPGTYHLDGPTSLLQLLSRAGGLQAETSIGEVIVRRDNGTEITVNWASLSGTGEGDIALQGGDVVLVPEGRQVYIAGAVARPGAVAFTEGLTVAEALTQVGGPSEFAALGNAYILRDGERVPVNLRRILDGRESDFVMRPDDQLFLRKSLL